MATETLTNRKIEAARNVLRQVGSGLPSSTASSPFGMAFLSAAIAPATRRLPLALAVGPLDGVGLPSSSASTLNQNRQPRQRTFWPFPRMRPCLLSARVAFAVH